MNELCSDYCGGKCNMVALFYHSYSTARLCATALRVPAADTQFVFKNSHDICMLCNNVTCVSVCECNTCVGLSICTSMCCVCIPQPMPYRRRRESGLVVPTLVLFSYLDLAAW
jgi:hypothetical protein